MKNLLILAVLAIGIGALVYWLWADKAGDKHEAEFANLTAQTEGDTNRARPDDSDPALSEVEISVDDEGLVLDRLYGKQLDLLVTKNEVKDVAVLDGILTFSELEEGNWNFKAINLEQYIDAYLK